ncbi:MAG: VOC family protein, partial [Burkholderiales bacterium]
MRLLHTMLRVVDLDKTIQFYEKVLGMQEIKRKDYPAGKFTLVFLGYGSEEEASLIELTYNWEVEHYDIGTAFGHIAIAVKDIYQVCKVAPQFGGKVTREPG